MAQKIIQVVTQMEAGGAQRVALLLHKELLGRGVDAELWFLFQQTPAYATEPGVVSIWPSRPRWFELPSMLMALAGKIRRARPTAMIAHTHYSNLIALPIAACCGVPARLAVHHNAIATYPRAAQLVEFWWKRLGCYTQSIAVSEDVRSSLIQWKAALYRDSTRCIYNGLRASENGLRASENGLRAGENGLRAGQASENNRTDGEALPEFAGQDILFNVGRLTAQKNQQAIVRVLAEMPGCVAVIAGRGPLEDSLQREACEIGVDSRLRLLGEVSSEVVAQWMLHSDVFLFPSKFEAMPMALLEAMQAGMAIVASDIPAHREVAGDCALLSDTAPVPLSTTIRSALLQQKNGNPLGKAAQQRSRSFTVQAMATAYLEAL